MTDYRSVCSILYLNTTFNKTEKSDDGNCGVPVATLAWHGDIAELLACK